MHKYFIFEFKTIAKKEDNTVSLCVLRTVYVTYLASFWPSKTKIEKSSYPPHSITCLTRKEYKI